MGRPIDTGKIYKKILINIFKRNPLEANDYQVKISGFGKWAVKAKKKRRGRNPQTGEDLIIDARKVVTFKSSTILKDKVNG
jgi:integration host factor subunit alpha